MIRCRACGCEAREWVDVDLCTACYGLLDGPGGIARLDMGVRAYNCLTRPKSDASRKRPPAIVTIDQLCAENDAGLLRRVNMGACSVAEVILVLRGIGRSLAPSPRGSLPAAIAREVQRLTPFFPPAQEPAKQQPAGLDVAAVDEWV
jgi:hypothetical protein